MRAFSFTAVGCWLLAVRLLHSSSYQILMPCRYLKRREGTHSHDNSKDQPCRDQLPASLKISVAGQCDREV